MEAGLLCVPRMGSTQSYIPYTKYTQYIHIHNIPKLFPSPPCPVCVCVCARTTFRKHTAQPAHTLHEFLGKGFQGTSSALILIVCIPHYYGAWPTDLLRKGWPKKDQMSPKMIPIMDTNAVLSAPSRGKDYRVGRREEHPASFSPDVHSHVLM